MLRSVLIAALLIVGCATAGTTKQSEPTAKRLYNVGEARFAAGEPEQAVTLWRHAITQLPPTEQYDALRHKLILRLAFGQIVAYHHHGKLAHLFDAKRMLDRYLAQHEGLFGDSEAAKAERGQVYEILFEIERRIEDPPIDVATSSAIAMVEPPAPTTATPTPPPTTTKRRKKRAREDAEGNERVVVVDTHDRPSVDDPVMRKRLAKWKPEAGLTLTAPGVEPWLPARAYVRIDGIARRVDDNTASRRNTQAVASAVIRAVRPALRACYDGAFSRAPADYALATVEFAVSADGAVETPRIVDGMVGDALGDVCVIERLAGAQVDANEGDEPIRLAVNLMFFFDGAVKMNEGGGRSWRNELDSAVDAMAKRPPWKKQSIRNTEPPRSLPPITQ